MDIDPRDLIEANDDKKEASKSRLNAAVAVTIALLATFMGICKVKDDNICQAMQQAQAKQVDSWGYYQAKNTQEKMYEAAVTQLEVNSVSLSGAALAKADAAKKSFAELAAHEKETKDKVKGDAEGFAKSYDDLNYKDDQFDLSDATLAIAISLLAVTSLTQKRFLFIFAMIPTAIGLLMGCAGLFGWHIHSDYISNLLSLLELVPQAVIPNSV